jgi:hypothetical protein
VSECPLLYHASGRGFLRFSPTRVCSHLVMRLCALAVDELSMCVWCVRVRVCVCVCVCVCVRVDVCGCECVCMTGVLQRELDVAGDCTDEDGATAHERVVGVDGPQDGGAQPQPDGHRGGPGPHLGTRVGLARPHRRGKGPRTAVRVDALTWSSFISPCVVRVVSRQRCHDYLKSIDSIVSRLKYVLNNVEPKQVCVRLMLRSRFVANVFDVVAMSRRCRSDVATTLPPRVAVSPFVLALM